MTFIYSNCYYVTLEMQPHNDSEIQATCLMYYITLPREGTLGIPENSMDNSDSGSTLFIFW